MGSPLPTRLFSSKHSNLMAIILVIFLAQIVLPTSADNLVNVSRLKMFLDELPEAPTLQGFRYVNGVAVENSLRIGMFQIRWKFHRDLPSTKVFAYGTSKHTATIPGPTIKALQGIPTHITWFNHLPRRHILPIDQTIPTACPKNGIPTVVHLHGGISEPASDGDPDSWFTNNFVKRGPTWSKKTYNYCNIQQPGNLWYHDHAMGLTRVNILAGLAGSYQILDPTIEDTFNLPNGAFDRHIMVSDRSFKMDGSIFMNRTGNNPTIHPEWQPEYFGDAIIVNGKAWPYMIVSRRRYRFRVINVSNARFFGFFFSNGLRFLHVGSDSAYIRSPVETSHFLLSPSEIADVIVDFSESNTSRAILKNDAAFPFPDGDPVSKENGNVMKFLIKSESRSESGESGSDKIKARVPTHLVNYPTGDPSKVSVTRYITMYEYLSNTDEPTHLLLNGRSFYDPATEKPRVGTSEVWSVINLTDDNHPLHIHLGMFVVLDQTKLSRKDEFSKCMANLTDAVKCGINDHARGMKEGVTAHECGWKNVFKMKPGYVTRILVRFALIHSSAPYPFDATGEPGYAYHCHILDHEDNIMMRPLKLVHREV